MRVLMLGTGAALIDPDRNHSSILLTVRGENYLFDCGHNATRQMVANGVDPTTVKAIFLSHLHFDHIADFSYHMISTWMAGRQAPPTVVGPRDTQEFVDHSLIDGAYAKDIEARVQYRQRQDNYDVLRPPVIEAEPGLVYEDDLVRVTACHVEHIPEEISPCFGLRMDTADGESVVFSGDTAPCDRLVDLAQDCDLLIHECTFPQTAIDFRSNAGIGTWAHTSPLEFGRIAAESGTKAAVATHFGHFDTCNPVLRKLMAKHMPVEMVGPEMMEEVLGDIRRNYRKTLYLAKDGMRIDV
ncbi:MAG: MBL fold metallo-hydrolase [Rhodospirillaceae bacterium]|nr:MBL fold metallo-hydrolase [Rhodospirillaceae bacterium]